MKRLVSTTSNIEAWADYFIRARAIRPDARLLINDYNILNSASDAATIEYRDLINSLRAAGAPIDRIGLQAHIALNTITKADIVRRLDILAETGLTIEITEFDSRDDADQLTPAQQQQIFQDMLEAAFEHESVDGFIMWGFWDTGHWRGNAPLFDADWNTKTEAAPWFNLVHGDWKPNLVGQTVNGNGEWIAPEGLFDGSYDITARLNGQSTTLADVVVNGAGVQIVTIDLQIELPTLDVLSEVNILEDAAEQTISLTGITAGGGEAQLLSITAVSDNTGLIPDLTVDFDGQSSVGSLQFIPVADQSGTATITVMVEDGGLDNELGTPEDNGVISRTVVVKVEEVNDAPTLDSVSDLNLLENSLIQVLDMTGITAGGGETQLLSITAVSDNTGLIPDPTVTSRPALGAETRLLTVTPLPDHYGIATITVTVEDSGLDLDIDTTEDNATFSKTFDVTVTPDTDDPPSSITPYTTMFIHETLSVDSLVSYQLPAVNVNGEAVNGLFNRMTATSSDTALIPDPTVLYASADVSSSLSFTPKMGTSGTATLSIQVEDGGPDNDFATTENNRQATHQVEVNVLEVISNQGSAILAKDETENLYVNTQAVIYQGQQAQTNIAGFVAKGATSESGENLLLVERSSVRNRLLTDNAMAN